MEIHEERLRVPPEGLSTGDLFRLMQKVSGDHCTQIGYGTPVMEELGLMWVIVRHGAQVLRSPAASVRATAYSISSIAAPGSAKPEDSRSSKAPRGMNRPVSTV